ncbi:DUF6076 domain-containing protein [uncultured Dubosiella sp.]|uniref:DUF6076 domain-containing protein n=2 Tax=uncultured Dubosiella sp. TaxID=1937011 RepID=UPI0025A6307A|nr:DUF6076 domain-containing protein [uncultured Dubosiella sp.]
MELDGLIVDYDGEENSVMYQGVNQYPIGGMIAEYARLHPTDLKEVIRAFPRIGEETSIEALDDFFPWFINELEKKFGTVTAIVVTFDFLNLVSDMFKMDSKQLGEWFIEISEEDAVGKFIFGGSGYTKMGNLTNEQLLLSAYYWWAQSYVSFKYCFLLLVNDDEFEQNQINAFLSMFSEKINFQHIDFRIALFEDGFHSLYTIKSSMSLMLFEAAHCIDKKVTFTKCTNCGEIFVPEGRKDAIYCSYPSPQNPKKLCKEIGAQVARSNREKNDITTKEYRKVYMKYKMLARRHPENRNAKRVLERLISEGKIWRKKMKNGIATSEDFLKWLKEF